MKPDSRYQLLDLLKQHTDGLSIKQIQQNLPLSRTQLYRLMEKLNKDTKQVYIKRWIRFEGEVKPHTRPVFAAGNFPDEPKPEPMPFHQRQARWRSGLLAKTKRPKIHTPPSVFELHHYLSTKRKWTERQAAR